MNGGASDLVVLVPDKNMEAAVRGLLERPDALNVRPLRFDVYVHVERDPGCFQNGHDFLRPLVGKYAHAMILFDRVGSGRERESRQTLEQLVTTRLASAGWDDRAAAIVLDPELEVWVWSDSPHVDECLGWQGQEPDLRVWLRDQRMWSEGSDKPEDPKIALERALRRVYKPRSSAVYRQLASSVSLRRCTDPAFSRLRQQLADWFPQETAS